MDLSLLLIVLLCCPSNVHFFLFIDIKVMIHGLRIQDSGLRNRAVIPSRMTKQVIHA